MQSKRFHVAIVGAGICGLASALAAAKRGKKVVVIDRDAQANGASVRNFGFVTVTGQQRGECWRRAMRSREVWEEIAPKAGIEIVQRGLVVAARRPEARAVLKAFLATEMGKACRLLGPEEARSCFPELNAISAALHSPHELRVESRDAIPKLAAWLAEAHGVAFVRGVSVHHVEPPAIETSRGTISADAAIVCPGDDLVGLFAERLADYRLTRCKLHMMRLAPVGFDLRAAVMSDLGLVRYLGYAELPEAKALRGVLEDEQPQHLANGVHLIAVEGADGSLVVGDFASLCGDARSLCARERRRADPRRAPRGAEGRRDQGSGTLDRHLRYRGGPLGANRPSVGRGPPCRCHQRHGGQHRICDRRRGPRRSLWLETGGALG